MHFNINVLTTYLGFFFFFWGLYFELFFYFHFLFSCSVDYSLLFSCDRLFTDTWIKTASLALSIALCWLVEVKEEALLLTF